MADSYRIENFTHGLVDAVERKSIPPGSASRILNWQAMGDIIEMRRGYRRIGDDAGVSPSKNTGLFTCHTIDGSEVTLRKRGQKLEYYDVTTELWREIGSDLFPAVAVDEDIFIDEIVNQAGAQAWAGSPNSGLYKLMINSGKSGTGFVEPSAKDNYSAAKNHKGYIKIKNNRILLWRKLGDVGSIRGSYIDSRQYTTVTNEVLGTGDALVKTFTGTFTAITGIRTAFALVIDAVVVGGGTETFTDHRDGTLTSNLGGTGTINYSTGAFSVTFNTAPNTAQSVFGDYQWEDSTNKGLADFTESATRLAGEGFYQPQGAGGNVQNVESYKDIEYCLHEFMTWFLNITNTDTNANNQIYRKSAGIPNPRASVATGDGIYFVDDRAEADVTLRLLTIDPGGSAEVLPFPVSTNIDLSNYLFGDAAMFEFGDLICTACATSDSVDSDNNPVNNRVLVYDKKWKSWAVLDYFVRFFATMNGALIIGDSLSGNVYEILSGFDDDGALINNYYDTNLDELKIAELKKCRSVRLDGDIVPDQSYDVYIEIDNGGYALLGSVSGSGAYVDLGQAVTIGATTIGKRPVGGGSALDFVTAYHYIREIRVRNLVDKFERVSLRFVATAIGYVSISSYEFYDITRHGGRIPGRYNVQ